MDRMLDTFDGPLAFATTPLEAPTTRSSKSTKWLGREGSSSSDTDFEDPMAATRAKMAQRRLDKSAVRSSVTTFPPPQQPAHVVDLHNDLEEVLIDDSEIASESMTATVLKHSFLQVMIWRNPSF
jgi:hypothetical protein